MRAFGRIHLRHAARAFQKDTVFSVYALFVPVVEMQRGDLREVLEIQSSCFIRRIDERHVFLCVVFQHKAVLFGVEELFGYTRQIVRLSGNSIFHFIRDIRKSVIVCRILITIPNLRRIIRIGRHLALGNGREGISRKYADRPAILFSRFPQSLHRFKTLGSNGFFRGFSFGQRGKISDPRRSHYGCGEKSRCGQATEFRFTFVHTFPPL